MSNSTQNETHNVCNERLAREGGQARCCDCEPHEGCTLGERVPDASKTIDTQNDWEKRFEESYSRHIKTVSIGQYDKNGVNIGYLPAKDVIKDFIRNLLADARKEVGNGIEKMYLSVADKDPRYDTVEEIQAYNQAIYEILATLKEERV